MLRIYNTLSGQIEEFSPLKENKVNFYLCGPTVYDYAHLGHGRSATAFDLIRRYLIYKGYQVTFSSNYTDIDDKMINRATEEGITVPELAAKIIPEYEADYGALNILPSDKSPKATDHIETMIEMVKDLESKGIAYELEDGVYFDVSKFEDYGKLSKQKLEELQAGARIEEKLDKRNPQDFVLWKKAKAGEPHWESPWGAGRPGWHIECSAMNLDIFGPSFDIHGGGLDLTFPHHECEIAQSEAHTKKPFVKYWMHNGFVKVDNEKMSKSLGNFFTLKDIFKKYNPLEVRYLLISQHYRSPIDFSDQVLEQAKATVKRLHDFIYRLDNEPQLATSDLDQTANILQLAKEKFEKFMDNDFDSSGALGVVFDLVKEINRLLDEGELSSNDIDEIKIFFKQIDSVLGVLFTNKVSLAEDIQSLIKEREEARINKDWGKSDQLRDKLRTMGYEVEDTSSGTKITRISI